MVLVVVAHGAARRRAVAVQSRLSSPCHSDLARISPGSDWLNPPRQSSTLAGAIHARLTASTAAPSPSPPSSSSSCPLRAASPLGQSIGCHSAHTPRRPPSQPATAPASATQQHRPDGTPPTMVTTRLLAALGAASLAASVTAFHPATTPFGRTSIISHGRVKKGNLGNELAGLSKPRDPKKKKKKGGKKGGEGLVAPEEFNAVQAANGDGVVGELGRTASGALGLGECGRCEVSWVGVRAFEVGAGGWVSVKGWGGLWRASGWPHGWSCGRVGGVGGRAGV